MLKGRSDLPLGRDASSRFLPWIVCLMVFLAALALAATMALSNAGDGWRAGLVGTLTVQIVPTANAGDTADLDKRAEDALRLLRTTPGIARAEPVPRARIAALLEPWLGSDPFALGLPVPRLIDVSLAAGAGVDERALARRLADAVPGATIDDHGAWLDRLLALARAMEAVAIAVMAVVGLAAVATVVFTTRTGLAVHEDSIEVLHLVGATDSFIAHQFEVHALKLALKGGAVGVAIAALAIGAIAFYSRDIDAALLPRMSLSALQWLWLVLVPAAAAAITVVTARMTVMRALGRML